MVLLLTRLSGITVHVAQWCFCSRGSMVLLFTWLSGASVHVAHWRFCSHGSVVLLFTWFSGAFVHVAQWCSIWYQIILCMNFKIFFLVLWKMLLGFYWGIALLNLQAPLDKMTIFPLLILPASEHCSCIRECVELCQTLFCFMKMILWFLSLTLFLCCIAFHNLCTY